MTCAIYRTPSDEAVLKKAQNGPKDSLTTDPRYSLLYFLDHRRPAGPIIICTYFVQQ